MAGIAVRYPVVLGKDDYTNRLKFYVDHVISGTPMYIDNIDYQMSYIRSDEAGRFMTFLVDKDITVAINGSSNGAINGASNGTISLREIINYVEEKTGKKKPAKKKENKPQLKKGEVPPPLVPPREIKNFKSKLGFDYLIDFTIEEYVNHISFAMDIKVLFLTVWKVLKRSDIQVGSEIKVGRLDVARSESNNKKV